MRNITALEVVIRLVDGVYGDLVLRSRDQKDSKKRKQEEKNISKLLRIRHRLAKFYEEIG